MRPTIVVLFRDKEYLPFVRDLKLTQLAEKAAQDAADEIANTTRNLDLGDFVYACVDIKYLAFIMAVGRTKFNGEDLDIFDTEVTLEHVENAVTHLKRCWIFNVASFQMETMVNHRKRVEATFLAPVFTIADVKEYGKILSDREDREMKLFCIAKKLNEPRKVA